MIIIITAQEAFDRGVWMKLCDLTGLNEWAVNEGMMDMKDTITLTEEEAQKLGLLEAK